jgi:hypothetical protein
MKIEDARIIARQNHINPDGLTLMDLIRSIQGHEGNVNCYATSYVHTCEQHECLWRTDCQIVVQAST